MSARAVVKSTTMPHNMQDAAILIAQDAILNHSTESEIASEIKKKFEQTYGSQ